MTGLQGRVLDATKEGPSQSEELGYYMKNPEQGTTTTGHAASSKELEGKGGRYLDEYGEAFQAESEFAPVLGYAPHADCGWILCDSGARGRSIIGQSR